MEIALAGTAASWREAFA
jgi:hypothetical protein